MIIIDEEVIEKLEKGGKLATKIKKEIKKFVEPGKTAKQIVDLVEGMIIKNGAFPAFPTNVSINEVAAHYSPGKKDDITIKENDVVKVDFGLHFDGYPIDTSITLDFGNHEKLLEAAKNALDAAIEIIEKNGKDTDLFEIGKAIEKEIRSLGFNPIVNLTGHEMERYNLHAGKSIYNIPKSKGKIGNGLFAIEPFATDGKGIVYDGPKSEIYLFLQNKPVRLKDARKLQKEILEKFKTFPFSSRWVEKDYLLPYLVRENVIHQYPVLIEDEKGFVSQFEDSILVIEGEVKVLSR